MAIDTKTAAIGILLIGVVAMAGWVGFLYVNPVTKTRTKEEENTEYIYITPPEEVIEAGLPDDWSTAPNASSFILNNGTSEVTITMKEILEYVDVGRQTTLPEEEVIYEKRFSEAYDDIFTVIDPVSGEAITGIRLPSLLYTYDTGFAGEVECYSKYDQNEIFINNITLDMKEVAYNSKEDDEEIIIGIASNKQWLYEVPYLSFAGNFCLIGDDMDSAIYNIKSINVTDSWSIDVFVQWEGGPWYWNSTLTYTDMLSYLTVQDYGYIDLGWFNYNRTYYGINVSDIVDHYTTEASGTNYTLYFGLMDDRDELPSYKLPDYNWSEVEEHIPNNGTNIIGPRMCYVNGTGKNKPGVPFPASDLKMCIVWEEKMNSEYYPTNNWLYHPGGIANYPWPASKLVGYPCFQLVVPGIHRKDYYNGVSEVYITIHTASRS